MYTDKIPDVFVDNRLVFWRFSTV